MGVGTILLYHRRRYWWLLMMVIWERRWSKIWRWLVGDLLTLLSSFLLLFLAINEKCDPSEEQDADYGSYDGTDKDAHIAAAAVSSIIVIT